MRSIRNPTTLGWGESVILDHWEMRSIRNSGSQYSRRLEILDHWEMRSIRNQPANRPASRAILDHWEMRSIRNPGPCTVSVPPHFRSLGNALYPELASKPIGFAVAF